MLEVVQNTTIGWVDYLASVPVWHQFRGVMLTDSQLIEKMSAEFPELRWERAPREGFDTWVFYFNFKGKTWNVVVGIKPGGEWISWRYGMFTLYSFWQSGGFS